MTERLSALLYGLSTGDEMSLTFGVATYGLGKLETVSIAEPLQNRQHAQTP